MEPINAEASQPIWIGNEAILASIAQHPIPARHLTYHEVILEPDQPCAYAAATGLPLDDTFLTRGPTRHTRRFPFAPQIDASLPCQREFDRVLYVAFFNNHFGHLLTESLGQCWHAFDPPPELATSRAGIKPTLILQNCKGPADGHLLDQLRERYDVIFGQQLCGRSRVRVLHAASPTLIFGHGINRRHLNEVTQFAQRIVGRPLLEQLSGTSGQDRIYLSRQNLEPGLRHLVQEDRLVDELRQRGWRIVHPQELSLVDQLRTYAQAEVIAGNLASALHLLMAFGDASPALDHKRILALAGDQIAKVYPMQFAIQGLRCDYLQCLRPVPHADGQTTNLTLIDQEFTVPPSRLAALIDERAGQR